jgi:hypothetical protein
MPATLDGQHFERVDAATPPVGELPRPRLGQGDKLLERRGRQSGPDDKDVGRIGDVGDRHQILHPVHAIRLVGDRRREERRSRGQGYRVSVWRRDPGDIIPSQATPVAEVEDDILSELGHLLEN